MTKSVTIPITNAFLGNDYTGEITVGTPGTKLNVLLDTGSSSLAVDAHKYKVAAGDATTALAQLASYGDGSSYTGAVIHTKVSVGSGSGALAIADANVAVAYAASSDMFGESDGILGLAYARLDDAFAMPEDTWANKYTSDDIGTGHPETIEPYLIQLAKQGITSDIVSFYTKRSMIFMDGAGPKDPLNQGVMVIGEVDAATAALYSKGPVLTVKVLDDAWYSTNLVSVTVNGKSIPVSPQPAKSMPTNSIVDSGTNTLVLGRSLLKAITAAFTPAQRVLFKKGLAEVVPVASLGALTDWPDILFTMQGPAGNVDLHVPAANYWQIHAFQVGDARLSISKGTDGGNILGLPLMNGYFTIFDGEADGGTGEIRFAARI